MEYTKEELEERFGEVWDTNKLQEDFYVESFFAPYVIVTRKSDNQKGTLAFQHRPRFYFDFSTDE